MRYFNLFSILENFRGVPVKKRHPIDIIPTSTLLAGLNPCEIIFLCRQEGVPRTFKEIVAVSITFIPITFIPITLIPITFISITISIYLLHPYPNNMLLICKKHTSISIFMACSSLHLMVLSTNKIVTEICSEKQPGVGDKQNHLHIHPSSPSIMFCHLTLYLLPQHSPIKKTTKTSSLEHIMKSNQVSTISKKEIGRCFKLILKVSILLLKIQKKIIFQFKYHKMVFLYDCAL